MTEVMDALIGNICDEGHVPKDWKDVVMVPLYKLDGISEECGYYRGIVLLSVANKIFDGTLLSRQYPHCGNDSTAQIKVPWTCFPDFLLT